MSNDRWAAEALDAIDGAPTEFEALARAARERGDEVAGEMADELARRAEMEP